ncbi:MAG: DUF6119 family protein [Egibacteraceae bacterium]
MRLPLNAFFIRAGVTPAAVMSARSVPHTTFAYWTSEGLEPLDRSELDLLDAAVPGDVIVALLRRPANTPPWQRFIQNSVGLPDFGTHSDSLGAILFCAIGSSADDGLAIRWVAWCFGSGSQSIRRAATDPRFGLLAALNTLAPGARTVGNAPQSNRQKPQLRNLEYRRTAPYFQQTWHRASRDIPVEGFPIDRQSDLVSVVGGHSSDSLLPDVVGGRSLRFCADVNEVLDLVKITDDVVSRSRAARYKAAFGWVDNVTLVYDEDLIETLCQHLIVSLLMNPVPASVDVLLPDDLLDFGDERSIQYVLFPGEHKSKACRTTFTAARVSELVGGCHVGNQLSQRLGIKLRFLDAAQDLIGTSTLLECLCADLTVGGEQYIAYDGDFYRVNHTFVQRINEAVQALPESDLMLPCYRGGHEQVYNNSVGETNPDRFAVLDRKLILLPGETSIEACDLIASSGALVHVKRKGKSSVLSHLFFQAGNSCDMLRYEPEAREQLRAMVKKSTAAPTLIASTLEALTCLDHHGDDLDVVFAFLGDWRNQTIASLPLFSRISLAQAVHRIGQLGYRVSVKLVGLC